MKYQGYIAGTLGFSSYPVAFCHSSLVTVGLGEAKLRPPLTYCIMISISERQHVRDKMYSHLLYNMTRAPRTAIPSDPIEPTVAAPAVLEALALAPVAVPEPEEAAVVDAPVAVDEPPVVPLAPVPELVTEMVVDKVALGEEAEPEEPVVEAAVPVDSVDDAVVELPPPLDDEQLSPALMAEQKAWAAGRTSSGCRISDKDSFGNMGGLHDPKDAPTQRGLLTTCSEHASGGVVCDVGLVLRRALARIVRLSAPD